MDDSHGEATSFPWENAEFSAGKMGGLWMFHGFKMLIYLIYEYFDDSDETLQTPPFLHQTQVAFFCVV